jgi:hypothetical protein
MQQTNDLRNSIPAKVMFISGIINIVGSPLFTLLHKFLEPMEGRVVPEDPYWLWSFYFCTTVLGFLYIKVSRNPITLYALFPVVVAAKFWGVVAAIYALTVGYKMIPIAAIYDLSVLPFFILLMIKTKKQIQTAVE